MIHTGDCLEWLRTLPDSSVQCCITSPPYYGLKKRYAQNNAGMANRSQRTEVTNQTIVRTQTTVGIDPTGDSVTLSWD